MDGVLLVIWILRLAVPRPAVCLPVPDRRGRSCATCGPRRASRVTSLGRLVVVASPSGEPAVGRSFDLDAITTLGRDVNNAIVIDDPFASSEHAVLTYRGRSWYVEDVGSTNGTCVNGRPVAGLRRSAFGDEVGIGQVRLRLERPRWRRRDARARHGAPDAPRPIRGRSGRGRAGRRRGCWPSWPSRSSSAASRSA